MSEDSSAVAPQKEYRSLSDLAADEILGIRLIVASHARNVANVAHIWKLITFADTRDDEAGALSKDEFRFVVDHIAGVVTDDLVLGVISDFVRERGVPFHSPQWYDAMGGFEKHAIVAPRQIER